jgi:Spy/CpxP family protein refolding chaperone
MIHVSPRSSRHLLAIFMVALFGMSTTSFAESQKASPNMMRPDMAQHGGMAGLNLSDKQRELYKTAMKSKMESMRGGMEKQDALRDLTMSDSYSEAKARELAHKHCAEMEANMVNSSKAMNEFYKSLSAEQKTKFKEMHKAKTAKMKQQMHDQMDENMQEQKKDRKAKKDKQQDDE